MFLVFAATGGFPATIPSSPTPTPTPTPSPGGFMSPAPASRTSIIANAAVPPWPSKDPDDLLDYSTSWTRLIDDPDDSIDLAVASVVQGEVTITRQGWDASTGTATVWLSGGSIAAGSVECKVQFRVTTARGRRFDGTVPLKILTR